MHHPHRLLIVLTACLSLICAFFVHPMRTITAAITTTTTTTTTTYYKSSLQRIKFPMNSFLSNNNNINNNNNNNCNKIMDASTDEYTHCIQNLGLPDGLARKVLYIRSMLHDRQRYEYLLTLADIYQRSE